MPKRRKITGLAQPRGAEPKTDEIKMRATSALKASIEAEATNRRMTVSAWLTWLIERELSL